MNSTRRTRDRGRFLTDKGWNKIWAAINDRFPDGHTLTAISELTDPQFNPQAGRLVSDDTVSNIVNRRAKADRCYIESLFRAFSLAVDPDDLTSDPPTVPIKLEDPNFVGRKEAIAHLNTLVNQGSKITVLQAGGGCGKTTLAQQYLKSQGFDLVLELLMAKERENITAVEAVIEEWLKQDFDEEPGREFGVTLQRLKRQLQTRKVGILIDNLEPALDQNGRFIEKHRGYVELLRVLADPSVQSVTLITSRDRLCDADVCVEHYLLPGLDEQAWRDFFSDRNVNIDDLTLKAMHKAYGGNAKAMGIFCGAIWEDFKGDMAAYWRENSTDTLLETELKNLVTSQFNRLQELDPEAYKLLFRLGCYRYQDVPTVPTEGLCCLLWDVPKEKQHKRIIKSLRNRSLVEYDKEEYWLHPMIREEAIARLRVSKEWQLTNHKAAEFWTDSIQTIETIEDAITAFEAYYHYIEIRDFEAASVVILKSRNNKWVNDELLGCSFYRLGLLQQMFSSVLSIIKKIKPGSSLLRLYCVLGDLCWRLGQIHQAIHYHK